MLNILKKLRKKMPIKNVFLITLDCLRKDIFDLIIERSDFLNNSFSDFVSFERAYASGSFTGSSLPGLIASTYCQFNKQFIYLPENSSLLYKILQKNGFKTGLVHSDPYISNFFGYDEDVDMYDSFYKIKKNSEMLIKFRNVVRKVNLIYNPLSKIFLRTKLFLKGQDSINPRPKSDKIIEKGKKFIENFQQERKFLWIHTMDLHGPLLDSKKRVSSKRMNDIFLKAIKKPETLSAEEKELYVMLYKENLNETLTNITNFLDFLKKKGEYEESMIIITADHGEELFEDNNFGHLARFTDNNINVPLLIKMPGKEANSVFSIVSLIDIPSTVLEGLKIEKPLSFVGDNLFNKKDDFALIKNIYKEPFKEPVISSNEDFKENYCVVFDDFKYTLENNKEVIVPSEMATEENFIKCKQICNSDSEGSQIKSVIGEIEI